MNQTEPENAACESISDKLERMEALKSISKSFDQSLENLTDNIREQMEIARREKQAKEVPQIVGFSITLSAFLTIIGLYVDIGVPKDIYYLPRMLFVLPAFMTCGFTLLKLIGQKINA